MTNQLGVCVNNLSDALACEGFVAETTLDIVEDLCLDGISFIQQVFQLEVCRAKAVAKVLCKNPATI